MPAPNVGESFGIGDDYATQTKEPLYSCLLGMGKSFARRFGGIQRNIEIAILP